MAKLQSLVLNERIIHDLRGDNGSERRREAVAFLEKVKEKCDRLVVVEESPWAKKAYELMRVTYSDTRLISKMLHLEFLRNATKCLLLRQDLIKSLPESFESLVKEDDRYLVAAHLTVPDSVLVTTDEILKEAVTSLPEVNIHLRDEFLKAYFGTP